MPRFFTLACLVFALGGCVRAPNVEVANLPPGQWQLDPDHASLIFSLSHAKGLSQFTGRFDSFDASLFFDPSQPEKSRVSVQIDAASVNTGVAALDQKLIKNTSALAANAHPVISFESVSVQPTTGRNAKVLGHLTLRGETRPVTLEITWNGSSFDPLRRAQIIGFSAHTRFDRSDFGADAWRNFGVGTIINVQIEAEFVKVTNNKEN